MRNRLFEISAALAGVAIVIGVYFYRTEGDIQAPVPVAEPAAVLPDPPAERPAPQPNQTQAPVQAAVPQDEPAMPEVDPLALETAQSAWQAAVTELEAVEAELEVLDVRFDAKEAELAEMESQGMDPEALEEEMLIFLDGIVDQYDALETRLAEAEALEAEAAERLAELQGGYPQP